MGCEVCGVIVIDSRILIILAYECPTASVTMSLPPT